MLRILKKNLPLIVLAVILLATLLFVDHTVSFFKEIAYTYTYKTNVGSVQRFSKEIQELELKGYSGDEYKILYNNMFSIYNKTFGEKDAVITFMLREDAAIYHSNDHNEEVLTVFLDQKSNRDLVNKAAASANSGEITLKAAGREITLYYQNVSNGTESFCLFMGIDRPELDLELNANRIIIPIFIIGLLLVIMAERIIWQQMFCGTDNAKRKG